MKIQVIKTADKNANKNNGCVFVVDMLLEPRA
jgi:hypothetical protein